MGEPGLYSRHDAILNAEVNHVFAIRDKSHTKVLRVLREADNLRGDAVCGRSRSGTPIASRASSTSAAS